MAAKLASRTQQHIYWGVHIRTMEQLPLISVMEVGVMLTLTVRRAAAIATTTVVKITFALTMTILVASRKVEIQPAVRQ